MFFFFPLVFFFSPPLGLFLFTSTQYSCLWITKSTAQSTQEAVWQGTRGSFSNISSVSSFFLICISTLVSVGKKGGGGWGGVGWGGVCVGGGGGNQPPTSISNSLCSPHASRGSDLTLPRRKKQILYNVSQRDGASGLMSRLGRFCTANTQPSAGDIWWKCWSLSEENLESSTKPIFFLLLKLCKR